MPSTKLRAIASAILLALAGATPCQADLFAVISPVREVLRINSTTGDVTRTYPFPDFFTGASPASMAFDGRIVYLTRPTGFELNEVLRLDVVDGFWYPPTFVDAVVPPGTPPATLSGLGYRRGGFGLDSLLGVSHRSATPPSHLFEYPVIPGLDPFFNTNIPPSSLPTGIHAHGADVDPATGDFWIAADQTTSGGLVIGHPIMRVDPDGSILETIEPDLNLPTTVRGLGFDRGAMFLAGREFPTQTSKIFEIDRATGAVLSTFTLPGNVQVGAISGGEVIPEPCSSLLAIAALIGAVAVRRRKQSVSAPRCRSRCG
jgi:hypothetical protein